MYDIDFVVKITFHFLNFNDIKWLGREETVVFMIWKEFVSFYSSRHQSNYRNGSQQIFVDITFYCMTVLMARIQSMFETITMAYYKLDFYYCGFWLWKAMSWTFCCIARPDIKRKEAILEMSVNVSKIYHLSSCLQLYGDTLNLADNRCSLNCINLILCTSSIHSLFDTLQLFVPN